MTRRDGAAASTFQFKNGLAMQNGRLYPALLLAFVLGAVAPAGPRAFGETHGEGRPFTRSKWFAEESCTFTLEPETRIYVNRPVEGEGEGRRFKSTRVILYALPNGNTIEQTVGCKTAKGLDWRYDIQHVAAQVRLLRSLAPETRIVLICAESAGHSWPAWRKKHKGANPKIAGWVEAWRNEFGGARGGESDADALVTLTGHSGGGSFLFGAIEGVAEIPDWIDRIAFLDANYSFDAAKHTEKFWRWLANDARRRLIVVAYDDRNIVFQGKKVVSPTGGTFRATNRMRKAFGGKTPLDKTVVGPFTHYKALGGRLSLIVHPNPENKILHTALVGEMNGLIYVETLGTPRESMWGKFGGPRAYTKWIQPEPLRVESEKARPAGAEQEKPRPSGSRHSHSSTESPRIPERPAGALGGVAFMKKIAGMSLDDREAAAFQEISGGNLPQFLRRFKPVTITAVAPTGEKISGVLAVMPDYLAVGGDDDFVRLPLTPQTAQRIADRFGCVLPTRKIVDAIDHEAEVRLAPRPLTEDRQSVATFLRHHRIIESQRAGRPLGPLVTGVKKDVVLSPRIFERPNRLALYGWRKLDGRPIQDLTIVHTDRYVDYSHGVRLVSEVIEIAGRKERISELLKDKTRCAIVSDEGPMNPPRYLDKQAP